MAKKYPKHTPTSKGVNKRGHNKTKINNNTATMSKGDRRKHETPVPELSEPEEPVQATPAPTQRQMPEYKPVAHCTRSQ